MLIYYLIIKYLYKNLLLLMKLYPLFNKSKLLMIKNFVIAILDINSQIFMIYIIIKKQEKIIINLDDKI